MTHEVDMEKRARRGGLWLIVLGTLQVFIGTVALLAPLFTGMVVTTMVGIVLLVNGFVELFGSFKAPGFGSGLWRGLGGVLGVVAGGLTIAHPLFALSALTFLLAAYLFVSGIDRFLVGWKMKGLEGRGWLVFSGILSLILGIMLVTSWPLSAAWALGTFMGIHIVMRGWGRVIVGTAARSGAR